MDAVGLQERRIPDVLRSAVALTVLAGALCVAAVVVKLTGWFHDGFDRGLLWLALVPASAAAVAGPGRRLLAGDGWCSAASAMSWLLLGTLLSIRPDIPLRVGGDPVTFLIPIAAGAAFGTLRALFLVEPGRRRPRISLLVPMAIFLACLAYTLQDSPDIAGVVLLVLLVGAVFVFAGWTLGGWPMARWFLARASRRDLVRVEAPDEPKWDGRRILHLMFYPMLFSFAAAEPVKLLLEALTYRAGGAADPAILLFGACLVTPLLSFLVVPAKWFFEHAGLYERARIPRPVGLPWLIDEFLGVTALFALVFNVTGATHGLAQAGDLEAIPGSELHLAVVLTATTLATVACILIPAVAAYVAFVHDIHWARFQRRIRAPVHGEPVVHWPPPAVRPTPPMPDAVAATAPAGLDGRSP